MKLGGGLIGKGPRRVGGKKWGEEMIKIYYVHA